MADSGEHLAEHQSSASRRWQKWEVEFARFFTTPRRGPGTPPPTGLRYLVRGKLRHHGTWLPAASPAVLCISCPGYKPAAAVLTVSMGGIVYEEHYVSILNFSWPQVTCVTQCPIRGSRVVFMSFCDKYKQIQKFAVRFPQLSDTESFLNFLKECSSNTMDIIPYGSDYVCEDSSASEYICSNGHHRPDEAASFEELASVHRPDAPTLDYHKEQNQHAIGHPTNKPYLVTATDHAPEEVYVLDNSNDETTADKEKGAGKEIDDTSKATADQENGAGKEINTSKEDDIFAQIKRCMTSNSFHAVSSLFLLPFTRTREWFIDLVVMLSKKLSKMELLCSLSGW